MGNGFALFCHLWVLLYGWGIGRHREAFILWSACFAHIRSVFAQPMKGLPVKCTSKCFSTNVLGESGNFECF